MPAPLPPQFWLLKNNSFSCHVCKFIIDFGLGFGFSLISFETSDSILDNSNKVIKIVHHLTCNFLLECITVSLWLATHFLMIWKMSWRVFLWTLSTNMYNIHVGIFTGWQTLVWIVTWSLCRWRLYHVTWSVLTVNHTWQPTSIFETELSFEIYKSVLNITSEISEFP